MDAIYSLLTSVSTSVHLLLYFRYPGVSREHQKLQSSSYCRSQRESDIQVSSLHLRENLLTPCSCWLLVPMHDVRTWSGLVWVIMLLFFRLPEGFTQLLSLTQLYLNDAFLEFLPASFGRSDDSPQ